MSWYFPKSSIKDTPEKLPFNGFPLNNLTPKSILLGSAFSPSLIGLILTILTNSLLSAHNVTK
jgi:hypothetical protein